MTSPSWAEAPAGTPQRSARPSWARRPSASSWSPSSAAPACASGCIPTKAWVQTAHALHQADEVFAKFGVNVSKPELDFGTGGRVEERRRQADDRRVAGLFKANGVEWVKGKRPLHRTRTRSPSRAARTSPSSSAIVATGSFPLMPPIEGLDSPRCVDSTGLLAQTEIPRRLVVLGGGIIGCEFASIFQRFGSEVTIIEMLDTLIPQEDADAAKELAKAVRQARDRAPARQAVHEGRRRRLQADRPLRRRRDRRGRPDARLRRPRAARRGARARGDRRRARQAQGDRHRRAPAHDRPAHLRRRRLRRLLAARAHRVPRGRGRGRERLRPRGDDRRAGGAAADLHRPGDRRASA